MRVANNIFWRAVSTDGQQPTVPAAARDARFFGWGKATGNAWQHSRTSRPANGGGFLAVHPVSGISPLSHLATSTRAVLL